MSKSGFCEVSERFHALVQYFLVSCKEVADYYMKTAASFFKIHLKKALQFISGVPLMQNPPML